MGFWTAEIAGSALTGTLGVCPSAKINDYLSGVVELPDPLVVGLSGVPDVSFLDFDLLFDESGLVEGVVDMPGFAGDAVFGVPFGCVIVPPGAGVIVPGVVVPGVGVPGITVPGVLVGGVPGVELPGPGVPGDACPHTNEAPRMRVGMSIRPCVFFIWLTPLGAVFPAASIGCRKSASVRRLAQLRGFETHGVLKGTHLALLFVREADEWGGCAAAFGKNSRVCVAGPGFFL